VQEYVTNFICSSLGLAYAGSTFVRFVSIPLLPIVLSVLAVSAASLAGALFLSLQDALLKRLLLSLVSFSTGALLGNVFLHLLPEILEHNEDSLWLVLAGILLSFIVEKFIHWRHCHSLECEEHVHPVGPLILIGDATHNVVDGVLIATSYLVSVPLGIATTTAVLLHEIPQELGDFAVLIHSGYTKGRALFFNFLSALTAFVGAGLVLVLAERVHGLEEILLPLAAGNFLYIAGADLIPELHKETRASKALLQLVWILVGIGLMYVLAEGAYG
jgi:zinc and cadmium transporter